VPGQSAVERYGHATEHQAAARHQRMDVEARSDADRSDDQAVLTRPASIASATAMSSG